MAKQATDTPQHNDPTPSDEQMADEESSLGSMPNEVEDIEKTAKSMGIHADEFGPRELNMLEDLDVNEKLE